ncbi:hypothetical protein CT0861_09079 [Colletotrichum tofieldiae]|uniref:Uncharacterized protein n=1 Tax=Colletotrichum tofieldiae TaxID=708197 RepID=A0A166MAH1_9PEZI|nr:hypothetical protein CT0861_09079 [Colletotrichum tofieldiae]
MAPFKVTQVLKGESLDLAKPFNNNDRRALTREVRRLIKKREEMDSQMAKATKRLGQSDNAQLQQEQQLQMSARMKAKENKFIRRQSKVLADREKLFEMNPSDARARDVEILKAALLKLRGETEIPKSGRKQKSDGDGLDDSSNDRDSEMADPGGVNNNYHNAFEKDLSKDKDAAAKADGTKAMKRKRADEALQPSKKASNGQPSNDTPQPIPEAATTVDDQPSKRESKLNMDESAKNKIKHKKSKSISSLKAKGMEEGGKQKVVAHPKGPTGSKEHDSITKAEVNYGFIDEVKHDKAKKKKKKKSQKPEPAVTIETEHEEKDEDNNSKIPTGQVSETEKHGSGSVDKAKGNIAKKKPSKKKETKSAASVFANVVINDADEQKDLEEWKTSPGDGSSEEADALKIIRKVKRSADDIVANMKQEGSELKKPAQIRDGEQSAANEGNKKRKRRNKTMAAETGSQVSRSNQDKAKNSGICSLETTSPTAKPTLKGPTRIEPPVTPVAPFLETAGRTRLNPWSDFRRTFSIQTPEPVYAPVESTEATKAQDSQVWVLSTTGSRKKNRNRNDSDTKSVTMTIGKVDAPSNVDQGSPTPPPKKEQKQRGRPKKVKGPLMPLESRPATSQGQMSAPGVRASEDLIHLITPYATLLGSGERAESLNKLLQKDKELLKEEKKTWFKAVGLPHDD